MLQTLERQRKYISAILLDEKTRIIHGSSNTINN